jgi:pyruvate kinase
MQVVEVTGQDVVCTIKNSATLAGALFTLHASQVHIDLPTLTEKDKEVISSYHLHLLVSYPLSNI